MHKPVEKPELTEFEALYHDLRALNLPLPNAKRVMEKLHPEPEVEEERLHEVKRGKSA